MQEVSRLNYLRSLGITNYMPRWQLAGAPVSALNRNLGTAEKSAEGAKKRLASNQPTHAPTPIAPAATETDNQTTQSPASPITFNVAAPNIATLDTTSDTKTTIEPPPRAAPPVPVSRELAAQLQEPSKKAPAVTPTIKPPQANNGNAKVKFALSFWRISEELMVVDSRHSELALPVEKLLHNILFALGYPRQLPQVEAISWPMLDAPHHDQGETAAKEMLQGYMDQKFLLDPGKFILLMGEDASRYLLQDDSDFEQQLGQQFKIAEFDLTAIVVPSLSSLLQDPTQKRLTWAALQPLCQ